MDEVWTYLLSKKNVLWLWYAFDPHTKKVLSWVFGEAKNRNLKKDFLQLKDFNIRYFCTDKFSGFKSVIPYNKHIPSKKFTQSIERNNLTVRTK